MRQKKILIVDDEPDIIKILKFRLQKEGYAVSEAQDGLEGLEKARQEQPDLIVLDVMMPKMSGFEVSRMLKFDGKNKHIPILMLTSRSQEKDRRIGRETKADEYVCKPFELEGLVSKINSMVRGG